VSVEFFTPSTSLQQVYLKIGSSISNFRAVFPADLRPICQFLNDQLTFIRNGMWETLAIYQATLGKYWEVPWYSSTYAHTFPQGNKYQFKANESTFSGYLRKGDCLYFDGYETRINTDYMNLIK
jgi:hypothetical protein